MSLDLDARYAVDGYAGIAWWIKGPVMEQIECQGHPADWDDPMGETFFCDGTCEEPQEVPGRYFAVMVGDDRPFDVGEDELTVLDDDAYCGVCGQIGCTHDGR